MGTEKVSRSPQVSAINVTFSLQARSICREEIEGKDFELEYRTALLAQTLRLSLYEGYLSNQQQELAAVSTTMLADRLINLIRL